MANAGPVIVGPTIGGQIAQAAGEYPQDQQKLALQQAEIDAQNLDNSSKKLSVMTRLISSNPALATNPQFIQSAQNTFKGLGMAAPMKNVNGVQSLDTDALFSFGPASEFMASNLPMILQTSPEQRADFVQALTGQALPPELAKKLSSLPQKMLTTPSELSSVFGHAVQSLDSLRYPGAQIGPVITAVKWANSVLEQNGMPGIDIADLQQAGVMQSLLNQANLNGLQGKAANEWANAQYHQIETALAPKKVEISQENANSSRERADASMVSANASASRAATEAARNPAIIARDYAMADEAEARTKQIIQNVASGGGSLKDLETNANNAQALAQRLQTYVNDPTTGLKAQDAVLDNKAPDYATQHKQLNDTIYATEQRIKAAETAAAQSQKAFQNAQAKLRTGSPAPGNPTHKPPADMRPNTVEYYHSLSPEAKKAYLDNPNVPEDVRAYLKTLPG